MLFLKKIIKKSFWKCEKRRHEWVDVNAHWRRSNISKIIVDGRRCHWFEYNFQFNCFKFYIYYCVFVLNNRTNVVGVERSCWIGWLFVACCWRYLFMFQFISILFYICFIFFYSISIALTVFDEVGQGQYVKVFILQINIIIISIKFDLFCSMLPCKTTTILIWNWIH